MEAAYKVPVTALPNLIKSIETLFDNTKMVEIIVRQEGGIKGIDYAEMFKQSEKSRKKSEKIFVPADIDLSALANEVNL